MILMSEADKLDALGGMISDALEREHDEDVTVDDDDVDFFNDNSTDCHGSTSTDYSGGKSTPVFDPPGSVGEFIERTPHYQLVTGILSLFGW